jgi:hypothetical protein
MNLKPIVSKLEGSVVVDPISFEPTTKVKCSLIDQYMKK